MRHRLYFSPGMFGFGRLGSYDYFTHLERALVARIRAGGDEADTYVVQVAPTASIRRRAVKLAELVASTCDSGGDTDGPIHLIGHSTGGLDARLVASPTIALDVPPEALAWRHRLASITTLNAPHFGTPLATFFTTMSGKRVLRAMTALTVVALSAGSPPLSAVGALVAAFGRMDHALGFDLKVLDRTTEALLRGIDGVMSKEVRDYVDAIKQDNGAMVQLMPEAMDLFIAGVEDRPDVLCQCVATMAPRPSSGTFLRSLMAPWSALSGGLFTILYKITSRFDECYPCAGSEEDKTTEGMLASAFGDAPGKDANDGVVPVRSQLWGQLVWTGHADHLDVLGHFQATQAARSEAVTEAGEPEPPNVDWLCSGSRFDEEKFAALTDAVARGLLSSSRTMKRAS